MSVKSDTLKGVKWTAIEKVSMQVMQFVIGVVLARLLDPSDFGIIGMLTILITLANTFIDGGFSNALIRKLECDDEDYSTAFFFNLIFGIIIYVLLCFCSPYISSFFNTPILEDLLKILSLVLIINSLSVVHIAILSREIDFKLQAKITFVSVLLSGLIGIYLAYIGYGVWALVFQQLASSILKTLLLWFGVKWKPLFTFSKQSFRTLFEYGSKILLSNLIGTIYNQMATILIGRFYTPIQLGYYARGEQFARLPSSAITDVLGKVTFPILSRYQNDDEKLVGVYRKYISLTSMAIFFILLLLASLAKPLILLMLSDKWENSIVFLQIFCLAFLFDHICKLNLNLLQVKGRSDLYLRLEIAKKVFAFGLMVAAIPFGVMAICLSVLVYSQISLFINTYYTGKLFNLGYLKQVKDFSKYLIFAFVSCIPSYLITLSSLTSWIQLLIGGVSSFVLYFLFIRKDIYYKEIMVDLKKTIK